MSPHDGYLIREETDLNNLSLAVASDLKTAISTFDNIQSTNDLTDLMISKNRLSNYKELFEYLLRTGNNQYLKRFAKQIYNTFGAEKRWTIFEKNLSDILQRNSHTETIADILDK